MFFVLLLGYIAGKARAFTSDQTSGLSKMALNFALPALLFVGMSTLPKGLLDVQLKLALCLIVVHVGLFLLAHFILHKFFHVETARSLVFSLFLVISAAPIYGIPVLSPLLGNTTVAAVGLMSLAMNLAVPVAIILFEINAAKRPVDQGNPSTPQRAVKSPIVVGIEAGLKSPLLWAPILGGAVALTKFHLPTIVNSSLSFIGSATAGAAVFAIGIILTEQHLSISKPVILGTLGRISLQCLSLFALTKLLHIGGAIDRDALICCTFPLAFIVNLLAAKYKSAEAEAASVLLLSTVLMAVTVPVLFYITR